MNALSLSLNLSMEVQSFDKSVRKTRGGSPHLGSEVLRGANCLWEVAWSRTLDSCNLLQINMPFRVRKILGIPFPFPPFCGGHKFGFGNPTGRSLGRIDAFVRIELYLGEGCTTYCIVYETFRNLLSVARSTMRSAPFSCLLWFQTHAQSSNS